MKKYKWLILGAGPAGLTFANKLIEAGENDVLVIEKENEAGGLCRSRCVGGAPLDIGGGHFLDVKRIEVNNYLFRFMPENEWNLFDRDSRIYVNDILINHPFEANIWQMKPEQQVEYIKSIAYAGCNIGIPMPQKFIDWIEWKLGDKIANEYMLPYNRKMFADNLNDLGTYWLDKLPNVSLEDVLMGCINRQAYGTQPGHTRFYYPKKYGYGEIWLRMAQKIEPFIKYNVVVNGIDFERKQVLMTTGKTIMAENIIVTIPWNSIKYLEGLPHYLLQSARQLKHSSIEIKYIQENVETSAHWIYFPDIDLPYHRILVRHNFLVGSEGYWTETNLNRVSTKDKDTKDYFKYVNDFAYPLNTINKPKIMEALLTFASCKRIYGLGRWGEHQHYNSDVTVIRAIELFDKIMY